MLPILEKLDKIIKALENCQATYVIKETKSEVKVPEVKVPEVKVPEVKVPEVKVPEVKVPEVLERTPELPVIQSRSNSEFGILEQLLNSPRWPAAVPEELICKTEEHKVYRAEGLINGIVLTPLVDKKFLDFGCGDHYVVDVAQSQGAKLAWGYDPHPEVQNRNVSTDFSFIQSKGPFDVVLMYDVIDHAENPNEVLGQLASVCREGTEVYMTCHPRCSRHGSHWYKEQLNKAFVNLIFSDDELRRLGLTPEPVQIVDQRYYNTLFRQNNLIYRSLDVRSNPVDDFFFVNPVIFERLRANLGTNFVRQIWTMRNSFYDYVLTYTNKFVPEYPPYVVASYNHVVGYSQQWVQKIYSNGRINSPQFAHTWELTDDTFTMRWENQDAPGGYWVDTCSLSKNKQSWKGINQSNVVIEGQLI